MAAGSRGPAASIPTCGICCLIAVSGYDRPEDRRRAQEAGFDTLISKPVDLDRLHAAIERGRAR